MSIKKRNDENNYDIDKYQNSNQLLSNFYEGIFDKLLYNYY